MKTFFMCLMLYLITSIGLVSCGGSGGGDNLSGSASDTIAPIVPTGLIATATSSSSLALNWTASTDDVGVTGYKIFRNGTPINTSTTNAFSDTGLSSSTTYTYTVSAYDAAGNNSAQSTPSTATTLATSLTSLNASTVPQNITATQGPGVQKVTVSWAPASGATSYNLYWSNSSGVSKTTGTLVSNVASSYTHAHLTAGVYFYVITAVNANGESDESAEVKSPVNLVSFVTSTKGTANLSTWPDAISAGLLTGIAAGDAICQTRANAANL